MTPNFAPAIIPSEHAASETDTVYKQLCVQVAEPPDIWFEKNVTGYQWASMRVRVVAREHARDGECTGAAVGCGNIGGQKVQYARDDFREVFLVRMLECASSSLSEGAIPLA